jgi:hypothetical protein
MGRYRARTLMPFQYYRRFGAGIRELEAGTKNFLSHNARGRRQAGG